MDIIVEEVDSLPSNPQSGVWYYWQYNYYYWDSVDGQFNPDTTDGKPGGGGTAEVPPPRPTQHPPR